MWFSSLSDTGFFGPWGALKILSHINEPMVRKWRKEDDDLRQVTKTKQSFRGNRARWPQSEDNTEQWVIEQRTAGRSVSSVSIRRKATVVARDMKINDFQGGPSRCFRFMNRRNFSIRTRTTVSQQLPKDEELEELAIFRTFCKSKITGKKIRPEHITNMYEETENMVCEALVVLFQYDPV